jgi:DNA-binding NarL/FixJ family response regulator
MSLFLGTIACLPTQTSHMVRLLLADNHEVVRAGLRSLLEGRPSWSVVADASDGKQAILKAVSERPDVAILDYSLPLINGLEATRQIRLRAPTVEVLIFTAQNDEMLLREFILAGARGYLLKSDAQRCLFAAVEALIAHRPFFTDKASETLLKIFLKSQRKEDVLTARERAIVLLIAESHRNKEVARLLNISIKTVEAQRAIVMRKLHLTSPAALVRYAIRTKIVEA